MLDNTYSNIHIIRGRSTGSLTQSLFQFTGIILFLSTLNTFLTEIFIFTVSSTSTILSLGNHVACCLIPLNLHSNSLSHRSPSWSSYLKVKSPSLIYVFCLSIYCYLTYHVLCFFIPLHIYLLDHQLHEDYNIFFTMVSSAFRMVSGT